MGMPFREPAIVVLRGGGDLASGVAIRLHRVGIRLLITELSQPLAVRRLVSFSEAVYRGRILVEDTVGRRVEGMQEALQVMGQGEIPVLVDPNAHILAEFQENDLIPPLGALIDGRMTKHHPDLGIDAAPLVIGLGPGYVAGENCHAVIETNRGHALGRVIWQGPPEADTGVPESVAQYGTARVLRAPVAGALIAHAQIGERLRAGRLVAEVSGRAVLAPFDGVLRGLLPSGVRVAEGTKIGDIDPRNNPDNSRMVSDKALAVGGGALEALLTRPEVRLMLWGWNEA